MERIRLTKAEKAVLRELLEHPLSGNNVKTAEYREALCGLEDKGLVKARMFNDVVTEALVTPKGRAYCQRNPKLKNPIPWEKLLAIGTFIAAVLALFVGCIRLMAATPH